MVITEQGETLIDPPDADLAATLGLTTTPAGDFYDLVVIGGGPAGLAAAVYGASEGLDTVLIERTATGGQAGQSSRIENYLGFPDGLSGAQLAERARRQAEKFSAEVITAAEVVGLRVDGNILHICHCGDSRAYLLRGGTARQLTEDHSWLREQIQAGLLTEEEAQDSDLKHIITRSVGFERMVEAGFYGPYCLVTSPHLYAKLARFVENSGVSELGHIRELCTDGVYRSSVLGNQQAVLVSTGPQNFDLAVAQDFRVAYLGAEQMNHPFRVFECVVLRIKRPQAICTLEIKPATGS